MDGLIDPGHPFSVYRTQGLNIAMRSSCMGVPTISEIALETNVLPVISGP